MSGYKSKSQSGADGSLSINLLTNATRIIQKGVLWESQQRYALAINEYQQGINLLTRILRNSDDPAIKNELKAKIDSYANHVRVLKQLNFDKDQHPAIDKPRTNSNSQDSSGNATDIPDKDPLLAQIEQLVSVEKPDVQWDDVVGLKSAKEALYQAAILPQNQPGLFKGQRKSWKGILFYGMPGGGKSMLAKALATRAKANVFMQVSSSNLLSKYQGESEKSIRLLFEYARKHTPAIIFIDEVDSLAGKRNENESDSTRRIKNELLVQIDKINDYNDAVLLIGCTNVPWELDEAMRRRFQQRIYIPMPDDETRCSMIQRLAFKCDLTLTPEHVHDISNMLKCHSSADIQTVFNQAINKSLNVAQSSSFFKKGTKADGSQSYIACNESDTGAEQLDISGVPNNQLELHPVSVEDLLFACEYVKPSVDLETIAKYEAWTKSNGMRSS